MQSVAAAPGHWLALKRLSDSQLLARAGQGDQAALDFLMTKYRRLVWLKVRSYFLIGADRDDLFQEGMIGLYKAVRDFRPEEEASFKVFAELCITRQIITAVKSATRQKHRPLNAYVSLDQPLLTSDLDWTLSNLVRDWAVVDPADQVIVYERIQSLRTAFNTLFTTLEKRVLTKYLVGLSYEEIAAELSCRVKSVDNALQRVKRKVALALGVTAAAGHRTDNPVEAFHEAFGKRSK